MTTNGCIPHELELNAEVDSKIISVTLYPYQADVTRTFTFQLDCGRTQVKVSTGFPVSFNETRLRIVTAPGVVLGDVKTIWAQRDNNYDKMDALYDKKSILQKSLARCKRMTTALDNYIEAALEKASRMSPLDIGRFMDSYDETGAKWDTRVEGLEKEIREIEDKIDEEEETSDGRSNSSDAPKYSRTGISFSLTTEMPKSVDLNITYGVATASWYAGYDVRAASDNNQTVTIIYKAFITNNTGESWVDTELKLGSVAPQETSKLQPWKLSFKNVASNNGPNAISAYPPPKVLTSTEITLPERATILDKSNANLLVPGRYALAAQFSRLCTPRVSGNVHLKAKITNTGNYPLLSGNSGVYLDGNFISSIYISSVNPGEMFDLSLGSDPSLSITYHPLTKETAPTEYPNPFAFKPVVAYSCSQHITVTNTRDIPISSLTVIDCIPTTEDIDIFIKLVNPPLKYPESIASGSEDLVQAKTGIQVTEGIPKSCGVFARWDMVDEPAHDLSLLGTNGKINWVCSIAGKDSVDLNLQWQVLVYSSKQISDF